MDVHKHQFCPPQYKGVRGRYKGIGRQDHLIPRFQIAKISSHLQRMGTGRRHQHMAHLKFISHPCGTALCKFSIAAQFSKVHSLLYVIQFFSHKGRSVKINHFLFLRLSAYAKTHLLS